jgi:hypothetical protein
MHVSLPLFTLSAFMKFCLGTGLFIFVYNLFNSISINFDKKFVSIHMPAHLNNQVSILKWFKMFVIFPFK